MAHIQPQPVSIQIRPGRRKRRRRRQAKPDNIVEILLVLDYKIYKRFYDTVPAEARTRDEIYNKLKQYYFQVFNGMDARYQLIDAPDFSIRIRLSNFIIAEEKRYSPWTESFVRNGTVDVTEVLKPFAETKEEIQRKYNLSPFDHAMAMSGYDLIFENKKTTLGYAYLNTTCQYWSVSFVEDRNDIMKTIWTAAHELGHSLCALHDGYQNSCLSERKYIMTSTIDKPSQLTSQNPWKFSTCSVQYFREMLIKLDKQPLNCLRDTSPPNFWGKPEWLSHTSTQFGTLYSPDEQCQRIHRDSSSYMCRQKVTEPGQICTNLWCHRIDPETGESECTPHLSAAGTTCGYKMWCQRGQCVFNQAAPKIGPCPFGDQPGVPGVGHSCPTRVRLEPTMCRNPEFTLQCCQSCQNDSEVGVRINRGTATNTLADNVMAPREISHTPSLSASSQSAGPRRSQASTLDLNRVTLAPAETRLPQAPPLVQPQPEPQLPPTATPRATGAVPPPRPATGGCRDTGSPFNQSVVGCRGFHTFCYLAKVRRDCCATCSRRANASPTRVLLPVDRNRRKRGQAYYYPVWRRRAYVIRYRRDLARIVRRSTGSGHLTETQQAGPYGHLWTDEASDVVVKQTTAISSNSWTKNDLMTTNLDNGVGLTPTVIPSQPREPGPKSTASDPGQTGGRQGFSTAALQATPPSRSPIKITGIGEKSRKDYMTEDPSSEPQTTRADVGALVTATSVSLPARTTDAESAIAEYENENVNEQTRINEKPHPRTNEQLHPGTNEESHPGANERPDIMTSSIDATINVGLFTNPLQEPPAAV